MGAGDWAEGVVHALISTASQHSRLHQHSVQSMLDASFKGSSVEHNPDASRLRICLEQPTASSSAAVLKQRALSAFSPSQSSSSRAVAAGALSREGQHQQTPRSRGLSNPGLQIEIDQLRAFDVVQLSYDMEWPMSLVVTQASTPQWVETELTVPPLCLGVQLTCTPLLSHKALLVVCFGVLLASQSCCLGIVICISLQHTIGT